MELNRKLVTTLALVLIFGAAILQNRAPVLQANPSTTEGTKHLTSGGNWTTRTAMPTPRNDAATVAYEGKVYVIGGSGSTGALSMVEVYDPSTDSWFSRTSMPTPKSIASAIVIGSEIYVLGDDIKVYAYDPTADIWTEKASIPQPPNAEHGVGVVDGELYVARGNDWLYVYDPLSDTWTAKTPVPVERGISSFAVLNGKLYAIGGGEPGHVPSEVTRVDVYDPAADSWTIGTIADMPTRRTHMGRTTPVVDGKICVIGGWNGYHALSTVEVYDPSTNTWATEEPMPTARYSMGFAVVGNEIYSIGGNWGGSGGHWLDTNEELAVAAAPLVQLIRFRGKVQQIHVGVDGMLRKNPDLITFAVTLDDKISGVDAECMPGLPLIVEVLEDYVDTGIEVGDEVEVYGPVSNCFVDLKQGNHRYYMRKVRVGELAKGKIAFISLRDGNEEIYVMNADGTGQVRLTDNPANDWWPSWSPDGNRIAFMSDRDGNYEIYVMNSDGTGQVRLTDNPAGDYHPSWWPDGRRIAFTSDRDGNMDIYVMNADGSGQVRLTDHPADDLEPSWSPDGRRIAFSSYRDGDGEIYVMNADGTGQVRLTNNPAKDRAPSWSPDGGRIAFNSNRDGNDEIYVMDADGSGQVNLTDNPAADGVQSWSPDGERIAFTSRRDGKGEIYVMNADGTEQVNLTNSPAFEGFPSWSPYPKTPEIIVKDLSSHKQQYYANEPITFRFTVRNQSALPSTFRPVIKILDANGATTAFTSQKDYTLEAHEEVPIEHVQAPMTHPWTEGVTRWQVLLIGPLPHYEERYAESDLVGEFLVVPAAIGDINARIASLDVSPPRVQIGDTLVIHFTVENTGERDWSFLVDGSIRGPGGYVDQLQQTISVPRGQVSPASTFDWPVPGDAPAGTYDVELRVDQEATVLDWWEAAASFMVDKEYSYVETREFVGPLGQRVAIHFHHAPGDMPGSLFLIDVLRKLKLLLSLYGAASGEVLEIVAAAADTYGEVAPELLAETATDGSLDLLFLQLEDRFNIGFLYNGASFLDVGRKLIPPATITALPMQDIPVPDYWRLAAGTTVVGSSLEQLAERYAPILYLHGDEIYAPDPVELMLDHASLREYRIGPEPDAEILPHGAVTAKSFDTNNQYNYYLDLEPDLQSLLARGEIPGCAGSPPYEELYRKIRTQEDSVIYMRAVQGSDWLVIQYWLFYFYNDWCNKHEGDWELVEVVFENVSSAEQVLASEMEPSYVAYSHHLGGERVPWSKAIWMQDGSAKRPLVFVARGSHANYPSPGWRFQLLGWDEAEGGQRLAAKLLPIPQTEDGGLLPEGKWAKFIGRWGESGTGLSYAPRGLLAREAWQDSYGWAMKLSESDPMEDARALWAWVGSPVELHVYDGQGRHVGPNEAGGIDLEIPGGEYEADEETGRSVVKIPDFESEQGYRIVLEGTGAGTADLVVAIPDAEGKQQQVVEFTEVAVQAGLQAELEVTGELDSPLKVDADGDGVFEAQREADETQEITLEVKAARPEEASLWDRYSWLLVPLLLSGAALLLLLIWASKGRKRAVEPSGTRCPQCGNLNRNDAKFCKYCGTELPSGR